MLEMAAVLAIGLVAGELGIGRKLLSAAANKIFGVKSKPKTKTKW